jgi:diguanylate cyclase (GGDEF)-like protein/PAS domain S-box-containing protein
VSNSVIATELGRSFDPGRSDAPHRRRQSQPLIATLFIGAVILASIPALALSGPREIDRPVQFGVLLMASALASNLRWKLPLGPNASSLSISYCVDFAALLLLGTGPAMLIAGTSAWMQSAFGNTPPNPVFRTVFNTAALILTVQTAGTTFTALGAQPGVLDFETVATPLVASALVYYVVNTSLVAVAVGLANRTSIGRVWQSNFLWTAPSYFVGAGAAVAGVAFWQTQQWALLPIAVAPVYLTYRSYSTYVEHIASEERHKEEVLRLHARTLAALEAARSSEERYALAAAGANDGLWDWDVSKGSLYGSERWKLMAGLAPDATVSSMQEWLSLLHDDDRPGFEHALQLHVTDSRAHFEHEYRLQLPDGELRWMLCRGIAVRDQSGKAIRMAGSQTDITEARRIRDRLAQAAQHDPLTDLPNRNRFRDLLQRAIAQCARTPARRYAVLFVDLDGFKLVNDTHGHVVGDRFLMAIAERLRAQIRPGDALARLGGDEFAVLAEDFATPDDLCAIAERILEALSRPFHVFGQELAGSASIGIVVGTPQYRAVDAVLRDADIAMYRAKAAGRRRYELFDPGMHAAALERLTIETELRRAVEQDVFTVFYQPIVDLSSWRVSGLEALVRWERADGHLAIPDEFLAVAEDTGVIVPLTYQVLRKACYQMAAWQQMFSRPLDLSVNISTKLFTRPGFVDMIEEVLVESGLIPGTLRLEIPESLIIEQSELLNVRFASLRRLQVGIHLDNFGSGYASLSSLQRYRVDALKLDKSFVARMGTAANDRVGGAIVKLARELGIGLIAEGVETAAHVEELKALECPHAQGYLFSEPLDAGAVVPLLARGFVVPLETLSTPS